MDFVTGGVAFKFRHPPFTTVGRRRAVLTTAMPMPEAAVDEDDLCVSRVRCRAGRSGGAEVMVDG